MSTALDTLVKSLDCSLAEGPDGPVILAGRVGFAGTHAGEVEVSLRDHSGKTFAVGVMLPEEAARIARAIVDVLKALQARPAGKHEVH